MSTQTWRATIAYPLQTTKPLASQHDATLDTQPEALTAALPGYGIATHDGQLLRLEMDIEAATVRQACDDAIRAASTAYRAAFGTTGQPVEVQVLTAAESERRLAAPAPLELVGISEIAALAGVSRQRAQQLTQLEGFPEPLDELSATRVYTRTSVQRWLDRWERRRTGRPRKEQATKVA